jgi:hypothetical protein
MDPKRPIRIKLFSLGLRIEVACTQLNGAANYDRES